MINQYQSSSLVCQSFESAGPCKLSHATAQSFIQAGGEKELVKIVYNGFDPEVCQSSLFDRTRLRQEIHLEDKFVIGQFSRLSP